jgi:hypothetical protein
MAEIYPRRHIPRVPLPTIPPYALAPTTFRFPALAALSGRAPLGGQREVALATFLAARLAHDALPSRGLNADTRADRAAGAKTWLSNLTLPAPVRPALAKLVEASAGETAGLAEAVRNVISVTANFLDSHARSELDQLAAVLDAR